MSVIRAWLYGKENAIDKDSTIWNFIASVEYSLQSAVLMMIITRVNGLYDAGIFMIAYSVTQMMTTIGNYQMRSFQASDAKQEYSFNTYFTSRIISVIAMVIICLLYSFFQGYDMQRMIIIVLLCTYRLVESVEDVFHGEMQRSMRLDVASKVWSVRIFFDTIAFCCAYLVTKNLIVASISMLISALVVGVILNIEAGKMFYEISCSIKWEGTFKLLWSCLPVCIGGYLYTYLVNAPKYAIDRNLSEEMQTIFNILFMPIFAINMLSMFIYKPLIAKMGRTWALKKKGQFIKNVLLQLGVIVIITLVAIFAGTWIGLDLLGWLYGVDLKLYKEMLGLLLIFGGFAAMSQFLVVVLTIIRKQQYVLIAYFIAFVVVLLVIDRLVLKYALWGAIIAYGLAMGIVTLIPAIVLLYTFIKLK